MLSDSVWQSIRYPFDIDHKNTAPQWGGAVSEIPGRIDRSDDGGELMDRRGCQKSVVVIDDTHNAGC